MGRRQYTAEERAAAAEEEDRLVTSAERLIADPAAIERLIARLVQYRSPRILRFSMRNQAMLTKQADERGTTLTDVDTMNGWSDRGRAVREEEWWNGYKVTVPRGAEVVKDDDTPNEPAQDHGEGDGETKTRNRYRMRPFFDISQTDGVDDTMPGFGPSAVKDPAQVLREALTDQLERFGYTVVVADVPAAEVNDDATPPTVTVPADDDVTGLAKALASVLSRPDDERPPMRPPSKAPRNDADWITDLPEGMRHARLKPPDPYKSFTAWVMPHPASGVVTYKVTGARLAGTFTVHSADAAHHPHHTAATIKFGDWSDYDAISVESAPDLPRINNVEVHATGSNITRERLRDVDGRRYVRARRTTGLRTTEEAPQKTRDRAAAIARACLSDYFRRDDLEELHEARARIEAPHLYADAAHRADVLEIHAAKVAAEAEEAATEALRYAALIAVPEEDR
ncbi:hypothetical protein BS329_38930 [Amycolatopsis coloradensis]|uniref:Uncharacterized protein n=1 Tax=Amycolatopsis coloradensis TaxID=76021 RepID=A0A1R0KES9_9PSEU|nr:hypothetical protein [Amycolatopsis coloradensis]OLZ43635.1 hypothetical protein BS329_38930 [Amycolatopsis coloradensis]